MTATPSATPAPATEFPFILPDKPGPHESQALATNSTDGATTYDVVYSIVTVKDGADVDEKNSAYSLASCKACTTVAVSVQLVLVVGRSAKIMPINVAEALNNNCPACITTAIADQIVVSVKSAPSDELLQRLTDELKQLDAIKRSGGRARRCRGKGRRRAEADRAGARQQRPALRDPDTDPPTPTPDPDRVGHGHADRDGDPHATPTATETPTATATATETTDRDANALADHHTVSCIALSCAARSSRSRSPTM